MKYRYPSNLRLGVACLSLLLCTFSLRAAETVLVPAEADWRYLSGSEEASSPDPGAWRLPGFDDTGWTAAAAAIPAAATLRADLLIRRGHNQYGRKELLSLANYIFKSARLKIRSNFTALKDNLDSETRKLNQFVIDKKLEYLERIP